MNTGLAEKRPLPWTDGLEAPTAPGAPSQAQQVQPSSQPSAPDAVTARPQGSSWLGKARLSPSGPDRPPSWGTGSGRQGRGASHP